MESKLIALIVLAVILCYFLYILVKHFLINNCVEFDEKPTYIIHGKVFSTEQQAKYHCISLYKYYGLDPTVTIVFPNEGNVIERASTIWRDIKK